MPRKKPPWRRIGRILKSIWEVLSGIFGNGPKPK